MYEIQSRTVNKRRGIAQIERDVPQDEVEEHDRRQVVKQRARMYVHTIWRHATRRSMECTAHGLDIPEVHMRARTLVAFGKVERTSLCVDSAYAVVDSAGTSFYRVGFRSVGDKRRGVDSDLRGTHSQF